MIILRLEESIQLQDPLDTCYGLNLQVAAVTVEIQVQFPVQAAAQVPVPVPVMKILISFQGHPITIRFSWMTPI